MSVFGQQADRHIELCLQDLIVLTFKLSGVLPFPATVTEAQIQMNKRHLRMFSSSYRLFYCHFFQLQANNHQ